MTFLSAPAPSPSEITLSHGLSATSIALITISMSLLFLCLFCCVSVGAAENNERRKRDKRVTINRIVDRVASTTFMFYKPAEKGMESCGDCRDGFKVGDECRVFIWCGHVYHEACTQDKFCPRCLSPSHAGFVRISAFEKV